MMSAASFIVMLLIMLIIPTMLYSFFFLISCPPNPFQLFRRGSAEAGGSELRRSKVDDDNDNKDKDDSKKNNMELVIMSSTKMGKDIECPVCLSIFSEGEELRQLKICKHMFHKGCIDKWLSTHFNCPVCRAFVTNHSKPKEQNISRVLGSRNVVDHRNDLWQGLPDAAGLV